MRDIWIVTKFTFNQLIHKKVIIISTILILLSIIVSFNVPRIMNHYNKSKDKIILIKDDTNIFKDVLNNYKYNNTILKISTDSIKNISKKINAGKVDSGVHIILSSNNHITYEYLDDNTTLMDAFPSDLDAILTNTYQTIEINKLNISSDELAKIYPKVDYKIISTKKETKGNMLFMMILTMILFFAVFYLAIQVSSSITTEKTSKIIETIATSTSPSNIIIGKTFGCALVGFCQLVLVSLTVFISAKLFLDASIIEKYLGTSTFDFSLVIITFIYFILGYFFYAFLYALTGSLVSKPEDIQTADMPVSFIAVVGFYLAYFTLMNPNSNLSLLAKILPISSAFCMPVHFLMGTASTLDLIISLIVLIISILLISSVSIKIYSNAIINYGSHINIKEMLKMYKEN